MGFLANSFCKMRLVVPDTIVYDSTNPYRDYYIILCDDLPEEIVVPLIRIGWVFVVS